MQEFFSDSGLTVDQGVQYYNKKFGPFYFARALKFGIFSLKFIYSEKATKILRNLQLFLTGISNSQKKVEIS